MRLFREGLKDEIKRLKQEIELLPKEQRKMAYRNRKEQLDRIHEESVSNLFNINTDY